MQAVHTAGRRPRGRPHDGAMRPSAGPKPRMGRHEAMLHPHGARVQIPSCVGARAAEHSPHALRERRGACVQGLTTRHLVALCGGFAGEAWCVSSRGDASTSAVQFNNAIFQYVRAPCLIMHECCQPLAAAMCTIPNRRT